ncbi:VOC family protein [Rhizobium lusitanum]|uniref:Putative 3-demethylubiquinone-9 3-methyltransferase (Glyoxalase superfamily) n=1 Tax=Rhizobium lusitanum TaxID=293958 RepID=A0A7X0IPD2_9HYPH|nr:VOC family protein [Rhizobium lusitanum]MBB6484706.1 putative 3-demethylubiquinone-9 3-methyltransferase (glyoxalase superfamily) [Rhizobium lusitanum]
MKDILTFLMFSGDNHGQARAAIDFYVSLFPQSHIERLDLYGPGKGQPEGAVKTVWFTLNGRRYMAIDSAAPHAFNFTPSMSLFVECETEQEIDQLHAALSDGGQELMPPGDYGFSRRFCWLNDRYGVSWQINLA